MFLPGLTEGTLPIVYAQTDEAVEEERRLLYVGRDQGPGPAVPVLGAGPVAGRPADPQAVPVPRRPATQAAGRLPGPGAGAVPRYRRCAKERRTAGAPIRPLRGRSGPEAEVMKRKAGR